MNLLFLKKRNLIISVIILICLNGCATIFQPVSQVNDVEKRHVKPGTSLNIFDTPSDQIKEDIMKILISDSEMYPKFINQSLIFELVCDTSDGRIINFTSKFESEFPTYTRDLGDYFRNKDHVNCARYEKSGKISIYWLFVWLNVDTLEFDVTPGYEDE